MVIMVGGEEAREHFGDERSGSGETGAYYGYVAFDCGPAGGADVVVFFLVVRFGLVDWVLRVNVQVGSLELEMIMRLCRRRMVVIKTLVMLVMCLQTEKGDGDRLTIHQERKYT